MKRRANRSRSLHGFTLTEFAVVFVIVAFVGILLLPWYARKRAADFAVSPKGLQVTCMSNERTICTALLAYAQDYDDRFPIAGYARVLPPKTHPMGWGVTDSGKWGAPDDGLLASYVRDKNVFHCPAVSFHSPLDYRYNDLVADAKTTDLAEPARTVVLMDGEEITSNVGHSFKPGALTTYGAGVNWRGRVDAGKGTSVSFAAVRHQGGANYAFADGHVEWFRPEAVFFPPQASAGRVSFDRKTKKPVGPMPGGTMRFGGKTYQATFHLR